MKKVFRKETAIGLSVIVALAVLVFGINFLKGVNIFKAANFYYASFSNVDGLVVSSPVYINGFKVGQVREMDYEYDNPGHVMVEFSIDKNIKLPQGTVATLDLSLLGTSSVVLNLGDGPDYIAVGSRLEGANKPGMLDAVTGTVLPSVEQIMPKVDTLLTNINTITGDSALLASVRRLDAITADLQRTTANLAALTSSLSPTAANLNTVTGNAANITADLAEVSGELKSLPIDSIMTDIESTVANLHALSEALNDPNSSLGLLMSDPALYNNINNTVLSLDSLFIDIKANPKRYINVKVF